MFGLKNGCPVRKFVLLLVKFKTTWTCIAEALSSLSCIFEATSSPRVDYLANGFNIPPSFVI